MQKIKKAVIPVAGLGTRFLPATKAMAKEIIPVMDKPAVQFVVEEALASGIEEILVITGRHKRSVEDHFDANIELEDNLVEKQKYDLLEVVKASTIRGIQYKRQHYPMGLGDAVSLAESFVGEEPFLLMLSDNILISDEPASKQLIRAFEETDQSAVLVQALDQDTERYGIVDLGQSEHHSGTIAPVIDIIEKPQANPPSNLAVCGRYVLTSEIFAALETLELNPNSSELELTDALSLLAKTDQLVSLTFDGDWYEVGEPLGMVKASIQYALKHEQTGEAFREYLKNQILPRIK